MRLNTPNDQGVSLRASNERYIRKFKGKPGKEAAVAAREEQLKPVDVPAGFHHLMRLFDQVSGKRRNQVVTSMAGAFVLPEPISSMELEAHCRLYGLHVTPWEAETIDCMDLAYREESAKLRG